jgi:hypothetical protein
MVHPIKTTHLSDEPEKTDCYSSEREKHEYFKIGGPDKFYKVYVKKRW